VGTGTPASSPKEAGGPVDSPDAMPGLDRELNDSDEYRRLREALVNGPVAAAVSDPRVLVAMRRVPRHSFVPTDVLRYAYEDRPLAIGLGQTIPQPSLVGLMAELLDVRPGDRVLEVGTGSGYQAAVLGQMTDQVFSVELVPELAAGARAVLHALGYGAIGTDRRDGYLGWPEHAPYRAIMVAAAPDHIPLPLVDQLTRDGGRLVVPVGPPGGHQSLWLVTRQGEHVTERRVAEVRFVPLTRR